MKSVLLILKSLKKRLYLIITFLIPVSKKRVIFTSYYGKGFGDNPKAIAQAIHNINDSVELIWCLKDLVDINTLPKYIIPCRIGTLKYYYFMNTATVRIDNSRSYFPLKKKNQLYIQTWHGFALKRIERDVCESLSSEYVRIAKRDSSQIDLIISDSKFMSNIFHNSFWYNGIVEEWGSPRNDAVIKPDNKIIDKVRKYFGIDNDKDIILYAPTFRQNRNTDCYSFDYKKIIDAFDGKFGKKHVFLIRLHPLISDKTGNIPFDSKCIINASDYSDMQELISTANFLISDYSSVMFDFALSYKPCFMYASDIEEYKLDRNFNFALNELPFACATNDSEFVDLIKSFSLETYKKELSSFFDKYGIISDGKASVRCAEYIISFINR